MKSFSLLVVLSSVATLFAGGVNLGEKYPATLAATPAKLGYEWECEPQDVWQLRGFQFDLGDQLRLTLGPTAVVFGRTGTSVLWAVLLPIEPGKLTSAATGKEDAITHIWLRFHPKRIGELFPPETVIGNGLPELRREAKRICGWKMRGSWQNGGLPMLPDENALTIDADTPKPSRRFYAVDLETKTAEYYADFERQPLAPAEKIDSAVALEIFDSTWEAFDCEYPLFAVKPYVDWDALRADYRPQAAKAATSYEAAAVVAEMLEHLQDLHVWVRVGMEILPGYTRPRPLNADWSALGKIIPSLKQVKQDMAWGRTEDGIGYINIFRLGHDDLPTAFDSVLEQLGDTWGLVIDLRFNGGGDERLAQQVAGRFIDQACIYGIDQYRTPVVANVVAGGEQKNDSDQSAERLEQAKKKRNELGPKHERICQPRGPWRYQSPVVVLQGQRTMSSAESFVLMFAQAPQVTTMGDRTAGSSANPRTLSLPHKVWVNMPRWLDMTPDGKPIDGVGVQPDVRIDVPPGAITEDQDPVLQRALEHLQQIPEGERKAGKRA